ncbi:B12-binding domain-containing radical SAM protein, partial [bacterium]|nr:B12-binding domain-containing radical SAM protein [bacterium]
MRVLFVRPNGDVAYVPPPMGLLYLSAVTRQSGQHEAKIIDARLHDLEINEILARAEGFDPDIIGITSMTIEYVAAHKTAQAFKKLWPNRPILMGGPYPSSDPDQALEDLNIDTIFLGESEQNYVKWLEVQERGGALSEVPGIRYRNNSGIMINPPSGFMDNLDDIPEPAWDLIDLEKHFEKRFMVMRTMNPHQKNDRVLPLVSSRGCPFKCSYCHNLFGKKVRKHSTARVVGEMEFLRNTYGIEEIEFVDDIFNVDIPRAKEIFREVIDRKLNMNFSFPNGLRSDNFDEELLDIMKEAGVYRLVFAIESGSDRIQKLIHKNLNLEKAMQNIAMADKKGFFSGGFFMMGFPTETEEELEKTIQYAKKSKLHTATFLLLTPFPGTEFWDQALAAGMKLRKGYMNYYEISVNLSKVPSIKLEKMRRRA